MTLIYPWGIAKPMEAYRCENGRHVVYMWTIYYDMFGNEVKRTQPEGVTK